MTVPDFNVGSDGSAASKGRAVWATGAQMHIDFMARALEISRLGRYWTSPNPHVGCVLVREGAVIAEGFTQPAGGNHAEVEALVRAGGLARGATAYVTLEPCAHTGQTGPCVEALIGAGVAEVIIGVEDPNPLVNGAGIRALRNAGISVITGIHATEITAELQGFLLRMSRGWGRVRLKLASSLDGRTAMASGESQWITSPEARADVQRLRAESSAILTGIGTVLADDCSLTVRAEELGLAGETLTRATTRAPTRVVLDTNARLPNAARCLDERAPLWVMTAEGNSVPAPARVVPIARTAEGLLDLHAVMRRLGKEGMNEVLVECGPTLAGALLRASLIDELVIYQAPLLLGKSARPLVDLAFDTLLEGVRLAYRDIRQIGPDLRMMASLEVKD
jgi:diaminohydroxyphosphoribosylaminopyrimidine deaminase/5-amino-6-(5-phosphoribosylamino)uracil reductase